MSDNNLRKIIHSRRLHFVLFCTLITPPSAFCAFCLTKFPQFIHTCMVQCSVTLCKMQTFSIILAQKKKTCLIASMIFLFTFLRGAPSLEEDDASLRSPFCSPGRRGAVGGVPPACEPARFPRSISSLFSSEVLHFIPPRSKKFISPVDTCIAAALFPDICDSIFETKPKSVEFLSEADANLNRNDLLGRNISNYFTVIAQSEERCPRN